MFNCSIVLSGECFCQIRNSKKKSRNKITQITQGDINRHTKLTAQILSRLEPIRLVRNFDVKRSKTVIGGEGGHKADVVRMIHFRFAQVFLRIRDPRAKQQSQS